MRTNRSHAFWTFFLVAGIAVLCYSIFLRKLGLVKINEARPRNGVSSPVNPEPDWVMANVRGDFARTPYQLEEYSQRARRGDCDAFPELFQYYGLGVLNCKKENSWVRLAQSFPFERALRPWLGSDHYEVLTSDVTNTSPKLQPVKSGRK